MSFRHLISNIGNTLGSTRFQSVSKVSTEYGDLRETGMLGFGSVSRVATHNLYTRLDRRRRTRCSVPRLYRIVAGHLSISVLTYYSIDRPVFFGE
jgi:hypothetical protein